MSKKVLVIDDDKMIVELVKAALAKKNFEVLVAENGSVGLEKAKSSSPDLIMLDLIIPDKNGFEILAELKQDEELNTIPVVVITAKDLSENEKQMLISNDVASMWQKGKFDRQKLIAHIEAQLE